MNTTNKKCPNCNYPHELDTCVNVGESDAKPKEGDFTICFNCAELLVFADSERNVRPITEEEKENLFYDIETKYTIEQIIEYIKNKKKTM